MHFVTILLRSWCIGLHHTVQQEIKLFSADMFSVRGGNYMSQNIPYRLSPRAPFL